jgi:hypothetical protein
MATTKNEVDVEWFRLLLLSWVAKLFGGSPEDKQFAPVNGRTVEERDVPGCGTLVKARGYPQDVRTPVAGSTPTRRRPAPDAPSVHASALGFGPSLLCVFDAIKGVGLAIADLAPALHFSHAVPYLSGQFLFKLVSFAYCCLIY